MQSAVDGVGLLGMLSRRPLDQQFDITTTVLPNAMTTKLKHHMPKHADAPDNLCQHITTRLQAQL